MIEEGPGDFKPPRQVFGEGFDTEGFGGVVAAVKDVQAEIFGQGECPMRAFAGDERIHALAGGELEAGARTAGDNADAAAGRRATGEEFRRSTEGLSEAVGEFRAGQGGVGLEADELAFLEEKRLEPPESQSRGESCIVPETRMGIERQMGAVNGEIVFSEALEEFPASAGPRMAGAPEKAVVNHQQIGSGSGC